MNKKKYNREKTLAIVTGLVCAFIFLAGTTLGAIHSISHLGVIGGMLSVFCYLICDAAIIWAAFIDYHEDKNAMEWTSWAVKYILSAYLLFSGGCIAWLMMSDSTKNASRTDRAQLYKQSYDDCMKQPGAKTRACERVANNLLQNETGVDKQEIAEHNDAAGVIKSYVDMPLFKYLPGMIGLFGLFVLTLVSKIAPQDEDEPEPEPLPQTGRHFRNPNPVAPFTPPPASLPSVSNGAKGSNAAAFRFKLHGNNVQITFRRNKNEFACGSVSLPEANVMSSMSYDDVANELIKRRRKANRQDKTAELIEQTL